MLQCLISDELRRTEVRPVGLSITVHGGAIKIRGEIVTLQSECEGLSVVMDSTLLSVDEQEVFLSELMVLFCWLNV